MVMTEHRPNSLHLQLVFRGLGLVGPAAEPPARVVHWRRNRSAMLAEQGRHGLTCGGIDANPSLITRDWGLLEWRGRPWLLGVAEVTLVEGRDRARVTWRTTGDSNFGRRLMASIPLSPTRDFKSTNKNALMVVATGLGGAWP